MQQEAKGVAVIRCTTGFPLCIFLSRAGPRGRRRDKEPWRTSIPPDSKYDTGMDFPRQGSFNAVDDYLDMDDALQNYILSLNDTSLPTGGLANEAAGHLTTLPTASKQLASAVPQSQNGSVQGMGGPMAANPTAGLTAQPLYVQEDVGKGEGNTSPTGMANVAGAGPFVFTTPGEPGYGGRSTSESGSGGSGSNPARQRKRREVVDPDNEGGSAEKKQQVMQEKNRLAQRRFRERQKAKVLDLHRQIDDLRGVVDNLQLENSSLQSQNSILQKVLAMRDEQITVMQENTKILEAAQDVETDSEKICRTSTGFTLSALQGKVVHITSEMLKKMKPEELMQLWQDYVTEISSALVEVNSMDPEVMQRIEKLINEVCMLCMRFAVLNPVSCKMWATRQYHLSEAEELKRWEAVMSTLDLTKEQKREIVTLRKMLLQKLQQLVEERRQLNMTIQTSLPSSTVGHRIDLEYLKANQAVVRLKEILRSEHNAMLDFVSTIVKKVLKPIQMARLIVQAYPSKPDMLAVASAVAIEHGEDVMVPPEPSKPIPFLPSGTQRSNNLLEGPVPVTLLGCGLGCVGAGMSEDASSAPETKLNVNV